jgi:hypothetical protein
MKDAASRTAANQLAFNLAVNNRVAVASRIAVYRLAARRPVSRQSLRQRLQTLIPAGKKLWSQKRLRWHVKLLILALVLTLTDTQIKSAFGVSDNRFEPP